MRKSDGSWLIVGDDRDHGVHRCTLAAASPIFEAAFASALQEGESTVYAIKESTPDADEAMLRFVYTT